MHQTISGETPKNRKIKVLEEKFIKDFLEKETNTYDNLKNKSCLYENKASINNHAYNYLNNPPDKNEEKIIKNLIRHEFDNCEKIYPYLGDLFLEYFFSKKKIKNEFKTSKFNKSKINSFLKTIEDESVKNIAKIFFENFSLKNVVEVEKHKGSSIKIVKSKGTKFDLPFDMEFFPNKKKVINDYDIFLLDGYIQSIGEIHHLLTHSNEKKRNCVIFCYGMSEEVKKTIIHNNNLRKTYVYPISFTIGEESINILNDIAVLHNHVDVINSQNGQTISQIFSKKEKIKSGVQLIVRENCFMFVPTASDIDIITHKKYLNRRKGEQSFNQKNYNLINKRIKRLNSDSVLLLIPDHMWYQNKFIRDLDYLLRFFSNCNSQFIKYYSPEQKKFYYFSASSIYKLKNKIESFNEKISSVEKVIIFKGG